MGILYSAKSHACYDSGLIYKSLPSDVVEVSSRDYQSYWLGTDRSDGFHLKENTYPFEWEADTEDEPTTQQKIDTLESKRLSLLLSTDWYIIRESEIGTETPKEVKDYRQALRDITTQDGYPDEVIWPELTT